MANPYPDRYTRAAFPSGAKGFLFIPRVGAIAGGTIDSYGWSAPFFDAEGNEIREDGVNLGTVVTEGDKAVPALTDGDGTTRQLHLFDPGGLAEWTLKRTPPGDFANLDWRGHAGEPEGKQYVLQWWGPPNRYWNATGESAYPPYTDRIYRRGKLYLRAPENLCGCALHKEGGALMAACMAPVGGAYADGNITHDKLFVRVVSGLHGTRDAEETGLFDQAEFDALVAEYNSAVLANRELKKAEIIAYAQRWHEIDLKDHEDLVDTTVPESEQGADNTRTAAELFPWHFNASGTECQALRRMTAHVEHQVAGSTEEWDVKAFRFDRLKLLVNYGVSEQEIAGDFAVTMISPTLTPERILNERVPMWRVNEDWHDTDPFPGSHPVGEPIPHTTHGTTGSFSDGYHIKVEQETFPEESAPGLETWGAQFDVSQASFEGFFRFVPPTSFTPDESTAKGRADIDLRDHFQEGFDSEAAAFVTKLTDGVFDGDSAIDSSRSATIEVAVDYVDDQEVVATLEYDESLVINDDGRFHDFRFSWAQPGFFLAEVPSGPPEDEVTYYAIWTLEPDAAVADTNGRLKDSSLVYARTVTLGWGGISVPLIGTSADNELLWDEDESLFMAHHRDQSEREVVHMDLRHDLLVCREKVRTIDQTVDLQSDPGFILPVDDEIVTVAGAVSYWSRWHMAFPARAESETYQERMAFRLAGQETELFTDGLTVESEPESFGEALSMEQPWFTFIEHNNRTDGTPWAIGKLLRQEDSETRAYISGERDSQAMPLSWAAELGGWAVDADGGIMLSMVASYNASALQVNYGEDGSAPAEPVAEDVVEASNHLTGGDLVSLNELTVPDGEHAAFFSCAFVGV